MKLIKAFSIVLVMSLAVPAQASIVGVSGSYTYVPPGEQILAFSTAAPGGFLSITGVTVDLGSGLQYDLEAGAPGFDPFFVSFTNFGATGGSVVTGPVSGSNAPVAFSYTDFDAGEVSTLFADLDTLTGDSVSPAEFVAGGAVNFTITFGAEPGFEIIGPNSVTVFGSAFAAGSDFAQASWNGTLEVEPVAPGAVPELGSLATWAGLCATGLFAWPRRNERDASQV